VQVILPLTILDPGFVLLQVLWKKRAVVKNAVAELVLPRFSNTSTAIGEEFGFRKTVSTPTIFVSVVLFHVQHRIHVAGFETTNQIQLPIEHRQLIFHAVYLTVEHVGTKNDACPSNAFCPFDELPIRRILTVVRSRDHEVGNTLRHVKLEQLGVLMVRNVEAFFDHPTHS